MNKFSVGDLVRVGPAYVMGGGERYDESTGQELFVVEVGCGCEYGLSRRREDDRAEVWISERRLSRVA